MTDHTRLIDAARAVIAAEDMQMPRPVPRGAAWLRWEAEKLEAQESAMNELREAVNALNGGEDAA